MVFYAYKTLISYLIGILDEEGFITPIVDPKGKGFLTLDPQIHGTIGTQNKFCHSNSALHGV